MYKKWPNQEMLLNFHCYERPTIYLKEENDHVIITNPNYIDFDVINSDGTTEMAFQAQCEAEAKGSIFVEDSKFYGNVTVVECPLTITRNNTERVIILPELSLIVDVIINKIVLPKVNDAIAGGAQIPPVEGFTFKDSET